MFANTATPGTLHDEVGAFGLQTYIELSTARRLLLRHYLH